MFNVNADISEFFFFFLMFPAGVFKEASPSTIWLVQNMLLFLIQ